MPSAFEAMRQVRSRPAQEWGDLVRAASPYAGSRPPVQLWHGGADTTVGVQALGESAQQWANALGLGGPPRSETTDGATRMEWLSDAGDVALETYLLPRMGHGVPLHCTSSDLDESVGVAGAYMLEAGISSTRRIASSWGLLTQAARSRPAAPAIRQPDLLAGMLQGVMRAAGLKT